MWCSRIKLKIFVKLNNFAEFAHFFFVSTNQLPPSKFVDYCLSFHCVCICFCFLFNFLFLVFSISDDLIVWCTFVNHKNNKGQLLSEQYKAVRRTQMNSSKRLWVPIQPNLLPNRQLACWQTIAAALLMTFIVFILIFICRIVGVSFFFFFVNGIVGYQIIKIE